MTEAEWLACEDPGKILEFLRGKVGDRKLRLFAVACCRRIWDLFSESDRAIVAVAERYADGLANNQERRGAAKSPFNDGLALLTTSVSMAAQMAQQEVTVAAYIADQAAGKAAMHGCPCPVPEDGSARHLRALNRLYRSKRWQTAKADEQAQQCHLARDLFIGSVRPVNIVLGWRTGKVLTLAQAIYDERAFDRLHFLADALEDVGCTNRAILDHLRGQGPHVRGCWVVDALLAKS
jgi:hypothetical protein